MPSFCTGLEDAAHSIIAIHATRGGKSNLTGFVLCRLRTFELPHARRRNHAFNRNNSRLLCSIQASNAKSGKSFSRNEPKKSKPRPIGIKHLAASHPNPVPKTNPGFGFVRVQDRILPQNEPEYPAAPEIIDTGIVPVLVNGERIEDQAIREEARAIRPKLEEAMAGEDPRAIETRIKQWARENVIERVLLQQAALNDPEPVPEEEIEKHLAEIRPENGGCIAPGTESQVRQEIELRYRIDRLFNRACANLSSEPRNKDITDFYRKNKDQFLSEEVIHAAHIVKNVDEKQDDAAARAGIEAAATELSNPGADFAEVADRLSDCPGRGGDLGWFPRGQMVEEFEHIVFAMSPGQTSGIFRSPFGYHIARLIDRKPAGPLPLEDVRDQIAATIQQEKRQKLIEQYLDKLWASAKIEDVAS